MQKVSLAEIAECVGGVLEGDPQVLIEGFASLKNARKKHLSFFVAGISKRETFEQTRAGCVLVKPGASKPEKALALIFVDDPDAAFTKVYDTYLKHPACPEPGIHPTAIVPESATVAEGAYLGPYVVLGEDVEVGEKSIIHAHCVLMEGVKVGRECTLYPHCVLREFVVLGDRVLLQPGAMIGSDGFGYKVQAGKLQLIPQRGDVKLHDEVHIGANSTIDRARFGTTSIGKGTKIDNLTQIAHNVQIGVSCGIAALSGVAGSTEIGDFVDISGGAAISNNIQLGSGSKFRMRSSVYSDVEPGSVVYDLMLTKRQALVKAAFLKKLPKHLEDARRLEKRVAELERRLDQE